MAVGKKILEGVGRLSRKVQGKKAKIKTRPGQTKGSPHYKTTKKGQHKSVSKKTTSKYDKKTGKKRVGQATAIAAGVTAVTLGGKSGKDIMKGEPAQQPEGTANGFGAEFRKNRNNYLNDRSKKKTFEWKGNEYHVRIKGETPAMLETQRKKTLSGAFSKTGAKKAVAKKPVRKRRVARLKKRQARATTKGKTQRASNLKKRISRLEKKAGGGLATNDLGLRNRPEKRAVRAMKPGSGKSVAAKVKRTSVPKNKKNMDLAPKRRKGASIKGYQAGGLGIPEKRPARALTDRERSSGALSNFMVRRPRPKAVGRPYLATNTGEPTNVRQRPGGMKKGGMAKKPRGVGVAKRGYGKALK